MRILRVACFLIAAVAVIQLGTWAIVGRERLAGVATTSMLATLERTAVDREWDVNGQLPRHALLVTQDHGRYLGPTTLEALRQAARGFNLELELVDNAEGDRFCYVEAINTPGYARVSLGWQNQGCSLMGTVDYVYLAGYWIELPQG